MNDLKRKQAPITSRAWEAIDEEATRVLKLSLAARRLVDFRGPLGWEASAVNLGRVDRLKAAPADGVEASVRRVLPLVELRAGFALSRAELDDVERGREDPDLGPLVDAAKGIARAEDTAVFHGYAAGGVRGIREASPHRSLAISESYEEYPRTVAEATQLLRDAGVGGPYAIALGPRCYAGLMQATGRGGYPVFELVKRFLDGPVVWAPAVDGAIVTSTRGGDFALTVGRDFSIAYEGHDEASVRLALVESFAFQVLAPEAAVSLVYRS